jgi:hypothetical protein
LDKEAQEEQEMTQAELLELPAGAAAPNGQGVHVLEPLTEYVFTGHWLQEPAEKYWPPGQVVGQLDE